MLGTAADAARLELARAPRRRRRAHGRGRSDALDAVADALGGEPDVAVECSGAAPAAGCCCGS
jgi:threonine dehydrogenase-like Zn-dependent dehydrogenase